MGFEIDSGDLSLPQPPNLYEQAQFAAEARFAEINVLEAMYTAGLPLNEDELSTLFAVRPNLFERGQDAA